MEKPKDKRGGAREGAGRKPIAAHLKKQPIGMKLPSWLIAWLDDQDPSRAVTVEEALIKVHKLKPPKE